MNTKPIVDPAPATELILIGPNRRITLRAIVSSAKQDDKQCVCVAQECIPISNISTGPINIYSTGIENLCASALKSNV